MRHPGILAARKWREYEKMKRKWRENEEIEMKWREKKEMDNDSVLALSKVTK